MYIYISLVPFALATTRGRSGIGVGNVANVLKKRKGRPCETAYLIIFNQ